MQKLKRPRLKKFEKIAWLGLWCKAGGVESGEYDVHGAVNFLFHGATKCDLAVRQAHNALLGNNNDSSMASMIYRTQQSTTLLSLGSDAWTRVHDRRARLLGSPQQFQKRALTSLNF